jgi:hypothetical protein
MSTNRPTPNNAGCWKTFFWVALAEPQPATMRRKIADVYALKPARIDLDHTPGRERPRIEELVDAAAAKPFATAEPISCRIPGHDHPGRELVASHMRVSDGALQWMMDRRCGFATDFDFRSSE